VLWNVSCPPPALLSGVFGRPPQPDVGDLAGFAHPPASERLRSCPTLTRDGNSSQSCFPYLRVFFSGPSVDPFRRFVEALSSLRRSEMVFLPFTPTSNFLIMAFFSFGFLLFVLAGCPRFYFFSGTTTASPCPLVDLVPPSFGSFFPAFFSWVFFSFFSRARSFFEPTREQRISGSRGFTPSQCPTEFRPRRLI